jgi:hypothetical protein
MRYANACIPLGYAWSSPFARWQGPLANLSSLDLAVVVTGRALDERGLPASEVSQLVLGWTVPQPEIFYGATTVAARLGAEGVTGPMIGQALPATLGMQGVRGSVPSASPSSYRVFPALHMGAPSRDRYAGVTLRIGCQDAAGRWTVT